jgi:hypothetical protein
LQRICLAARVTGAKTRPESEIKAARCTMYDNVACRRKTNTYATCSFAPTRHKNGAWPLHRPPWYDDAVVAPLEHSNYAKPNGPSPAAMVWVHRREARRFTSPSPLPPSPVAAATPAWQRNSIRSLPARPHEERRSPRTAAVTLAQHPSRSSSGGANVHLSDRTAPKQDTFGDTSSAAPTASLAKTPAPAAGRRSCAMTLPAGRTATTTAALPAGIFLDAPTPLSLDAALGLELPLVEPSRLSAAPNSSTKPTLSRIRSRTDSAGSSGRATI